MKKCNYKIRMSNMEKPVFECKMKKYFNTIACKNAYTYLQEEPGYYNLGDNIYITKVGATYNFNLYGMVIPILRILQEYGFSMEDTRTIKGCEKIKPYVLKYLNEKIKSLNDARQEYIDLGGTVDD